MTPNTNCSNNARMLMRALLLCLVPAAAWCTEVTQITYKTAAGIVTVPSYTYGHCRFECMTPEGWSAKLDAGRDAVVMYKCESNNAFMVVSVTPASVASTFLEEWRTPMLQKELTTGRPYTVQGFAFSLIDSTTNWVVWGALADRHHTTGATVSVAEYHSYHVRYGYLFHICLIAPAAEAKQHLQAFDYLRTSFRSLEFKGEQAAGIL